MIAGPVRQRVGFESVSVRTGFEMDRVTHGHLFFFTTTIILPFQSRSTKARHRFVCHRRHINLTTDGCLWKSTSKNPLQNRDLWSCKFI